MPAASRLAPEFGGLDPDLLRFLHREKRAAHGYLKLACSCPAYLVSPRQLRTHLLQERDNGHLFVLVSPRIEPDGLYSFFIFAFGALIRFPGLFFGLLRTAVRYHCTPRFAKAPVTAVPNAGFLRAQE